MSILFPVGTVIVRCRGSRDAPNQLRIVAGPLVSTLDYISALASLAGQISDIGVTGFVTRTLYAHASVISEAKVNDRLG